MKISVIIPTYKPNSYIKDCLWSLAKQTFPKKEYEIILVLNGCNEPYFTYIKELICSMPSDLSINYIQTDQPGVSNARNLGLNSAQGEYICFIDDDDFVSDTYLEQLFIHASKTCISLCKPLSFVDGTTNYKPYSITQDYDTWCNKPQIPYYKPRRFFNGPVYKLIHKDIIGNRRFDVRFKNGEDSLFMFLISNRFETVEFTDESAIYYRRIRKNSANSNNNNLKYLIKNNLKLINEQCKIYFHNTREYEFRFFISMMTGRIRIIILHLL